MLKFLICLPRYHTNAVPWVRILKKAGHKVKINVVEIGATENYGLLHPIVFYPCLLSRMLMRWSSGNVANAPYSFPSPVSYWKYLKDENPDVVIVRGVTRWFCRIAAICTILQNKKLVIYDQEDVAPQQWSGTWIRRAFFQFFSIPHFTSRLSSFRAKKMIGCAIPLPFGCQMEWDRAYALSKRHLQWPPRILMVAKYRERKGHEQILDALAVVAQSTEFTLTFCGEVISQTDSEFCLKLQQRAHSLGISDRLQFKNNVAHDEMISVYSSHDLFILPSRYEPAAVSPIEAAWSGCAVLISQDSGTRGYIPSGKEFEFRADDPSDIVRAVSAVLENSRKLQLTRDLCFTHISTISGEKEILEIFESFSSKMSCFDEKYIR